MLRWRYGSAYADIVYEPVYIETRTPVADGIIVPMQLCGKPADEMMVGYYYAYRSTVAGSPSLGRHDHSEPTRSTLAGTE
jgi:hypothetical protein